MSKKRVSYDGSKKWFVDFLPSEVLYSLTSDDQVRYRKVDKFREQCSVSNSLISDSEKQIEKLKQKIVKERFKIKGDFEHPGYEMRIKRLLGEITSVEKDFNIWCTINVRNRSSVSKRLKDGDVRKNKLDTEFGIEKNQYGKKELKNNYLWYSRVEKPHSNLRGDLYLGKEENIRQFLSELFNEDWSKDDVEDVKTEIKGIVSQYSRNKIYHSNWIEFKSETHNLESMKNWCDKIGDERYEWGGVKS